MVKSTKLSIGETINGMETSPVNVGIHVETKFGRRIGVREIAIRVVLTIKLIAPPGNNTDASAVHKV